MQSSYGEVCVGDLKTDYTYQRPLNKAWLKKIIAEYDPRLLRPLVVSRRENGDEYIIDGNHTKEATIATVGRNANLYAKVYTGLTIEQEAMLFNQLNSNSKKVSHNEKLRALVLAGDESSFRYINALEKSGIEWAYKGGGGRKVFDAHKMGSKLLDIYGETIFVNALKVIKLADNEELYNGKFLGGVCYVLEQTNIDKIQLSESLKTVSMANVVKRTHLYGTAAHAVTRPANRLYGLAILDCYNKGKRKNKRIELAAI